MNGINESRPGKIFRRMDTRVFEAMRPYFMERFGNAASLNHVFGWAAQDACDQAREQVARLINARAGREIIFTGGGIESVMLAVAGVAGAYADRGRHLITVVAAPVAAQTVFRSLEDRGYSVTRVPVDEDGRVDPEAVRSAVTPQTVLISVPAVNLDTGAVNPIADIGAVARETDVVFHADGTQAVGRIPVDVQAMDIGVLSIASETVYGPRGVGALYVRGRKPRVTLTPLIDGGGQERNWRSGTLNVPGIVGLGAGCALCAEELSTEAARLRGWRDALYARISAEIDGVALIGHSAERMPGVLSVRIPDADRDALVRRVEEKRKAAGVEGVAVRVPDASVLRACGFDEKRVQTVVGIYLNRFCTERDIDAIAALIVEQAAFQ